MGRLEAAAALPIPLDTKVVRRSEANAIALPGGHIYVFDGLVEKSESADELAGVIAHEIGHVAHRDGTRSILQSAGLSFLFGMLLGDFVGGGAVVIGARAVLQSSYSRDVEGAADRYGVDLMSRAGGDPRALGVILDAHRGCDPSGHGNFERSSRYESARRCDKHSRGGLVAAATAAGACRMARAEAYLHGPMRRAYFARRIQADPTSRLAIWARRVAGFAVAVLLLAIVDRARRHSGNHPLARGRRRRVHSRRHRDPARAARVHRDLARRARRASAWR